MGSHCNITGSLTASLHPLVIMNISEHWTRLKAQNSEEQQVVGALIGKQEGRNIEIMNSFELLFDRVEMEIIIDKTYYLQKENQFKQVFPDLDFLGWYTTGDTPDDSDIKVHQQICEINESPVLLKLNPYVCCLLFLLISSIYLLKFMKIFILSRVVIQNYLLKCSKQLLILLVGNLKCYLLT